MYKPKGWRKTPLLRHDSKNIHPKDIKTPKPSKAPQSLWNGCSCIRNFVVMKDSGRSESNPAYKTHHFLGGRCRIESPYRGHCTTNASLVHYYKRNPSRWPYICRKFDPQKKMGPIYIMRPCHLKILNFSRKCPPIHCLLPVPCLRRFICCRDLIDLSLRRLITCLKICFHTADGSEIPWTNSWGKGSLSLYLEG